MTDVSKELGRSRPFLLRERDETAPPSDRGDLPLLSAPSSRRAGAGKPVSGSSASKDPSPQGSGIRPAGLLFSTAIARALSRSREASWIPSPIDPPLPAPGLSLSFFFYRQTAERLAGLSRRQGPSSGGGLKGNSWKRAEPSTPATSDYAMGGDTPALRCAAQAAVPIIQQHLDEARRLDR